MWGGVASKTMRGDFPKRRRGSRNNEKSGGRIVDGFGIDSSFAVLVCGGAVLDNLRGGWG